ncbi:hypothetical protein GYMLUDRAFT_251430 [Collybiopsis luxurians FD-317 M1]|uniref:Uncharacterized protein n=1 Tax=Collybiopsis luxurians FD-317 M1 TaxID=944289 RepID=A0A0D0CBD4_9AGAR|nr:hypothetical protein GYMLUDRAFT_251430 [Collybiopsis luxurians FD-317 M1]
MLSTTFPNPVHSLVLTKLPLLGNNQLHNRPSSPIVIDQDLQQLYEQVLAGFNSEEGDSPTMTVESGLTSATYSTASHNSGYSDASSAHTPSPQPRPQDGHRRFPDSMAGKDMEDIEKLYSVYTANPSPESGYGYSSLLTTASSYYSHCHQNSSSSYNDLSSSHILSPISPASTTAATYAQSARSPTSHLTYK